MYDKKPDCRAAGKPERVVAQIPEQSEDPPGANLSHR
jgi:hypothetical protein